jgi:DNA modification methylase
MPKSKIRDVFQVECLVPSGKLNAQTSNLYNVDLAFNGCETQHSTHALHPYVAAINPPLVQALIENYIPKGESILDPYCGGGGVLIESMLANRPCAGGEINPLGVIISKAKTTYIEKSVIDKYLKEITDLAKKIRPDVSLKPNKFLDFWYREENLLDLTSINEALKIVTKGKNKILPLFQTILSATARDVMLTYRGEVRLRKLQGNDLEKFRADVFTVFQKRGLLASERVSQLPKKSVVDIEKRDIRHLPFPDKKFYGIICSPPYADDKNGVGYFQFSINMLYLLGFTKEEIAADRALFHGTIKEGKTPPKSASLEKSLNNVIKSDSKKWQEAVAFYSDFAEGLSEMARVTRNKIIMVVGNRVLARTSFDNAAITVDIFKNLGVKLEHHYTRELKKKRIPNLGGDGGGINIEHILVFSK